MASIGITNSGGGARGGGKRITAGPNKGATRKRSAVKTPRVNLDATYGITNQRANTRSAVTGPTTNRAKHADNQSTLTRKASRHVK